MPGLTDEPAPEPTIPPTLSAIEPTAPDTQRAIVISAVMTVSPVAADDTAVAVKTEAEDADAAEPEVKQEISEERQQEAREFIASHMAADIALMKTMIVFPEMMSLLMSARSYLAMTDFSVYEFERMLIFPQCSNMLNTVMTALLCTERERERISELPCMPYGIWMQRFKRKVSRWFSWYELRPAGHVTVFEIDAEFWKIVGEDNPLQNLLMHEIPFVQRVWFLKALCDSMLSIHPKLREVWSKLSADDLRDMRDLGNDADGNRFFHLRTLAEDDLRVYRVGPSEEQAKKAIPQPKPIQRKKRRGRPRKMPLASSDSSTASTSDPETLPVSAPTASYLAENGAFDLVVDNLESLKELINFYQTKTEESSRPASEVELLEKLEELLSDFMEFEVTLEQRLVMSQTEIFTGWTKYQERPAGFVDPDAEDWDKTLKPSRSGTPVFASASDGEDTVEFEPKSSMEPLEELTANTPSSKPILFAPVVTRSGRTVTRKMPLEYGELSGDSDEDDVWTEPGKKKATPKKPRACDAGEADPNAEGQKRKRKKKRKLADDTVPKKKNTSEDGSLKKKKKKKATVEVAQTGNVVMGDPSSATISANVQNLPKIPPETDIAPKTSDAVPSTDVAPIVMTAVCGTTSVPQTLMSRPSIISETGSASVPIESANPSNVPAVNIASLLSSSPAIPGRPITISVVQNGTGAVPSVASPRTPSSANNSPGVIRSVGSAITVTPRVKRPAVSRRISNAINNGATSAPTTPTICNGATSIMPSLPTPRISSQVSVTKVSKKREVIVIDSDDDDDQLPAIRLPSSCSLVRVKKSTPPVGLHRLPTAISILPVDKPRPPVLGTIVISDDEEPEEKAEYRVVLSDKGQNYAKVLPDGRLRVLTDEQVAAIRARNNGKLL